MRIKNLVFILSIILLTILPIKLLAYAEDDEKGIILIDPGHGGIDGGAKGQSGTLEKEINLAISKKLKSRLEDEGYKAYLTREDDSELAKGKSADLEMRCKMKRETNCDIFISIHQNKFRMEQCFGAQVWYADNAESAKIATLIQESLKEKIDDNNNRLAKPAKQQYKILRDRYDGASVIVECGFVSNYKEEKLLNSEEHQDKIVDGIACAIDKYFEEKG